MAMQLPSNPEALTIAYMAMGAHEYISERVGRANARGDRADIFRERHGEQEGIEKIIEYAGLLEAFLTAYKKNADNVASFAYEVCQPVGHALAAILDRPEDDEAILNIRLVLQEIQHAFFAACPRSDLSAIQDAMYDMILLYVH